MDAQTLEPADERIIAGNAYVRGEMRKPVYVRSADDWYREPASAVHVLLDVEHFGRTIWDPACGAGNVPDTAKARGYQVVGSDLVDRAEGRFITPMDFLEVGRVAGFVKAHRVDSIVTNPPFNRAREFVTTALAMGPHKVAVLQRLAWPEGVDRSAWMRQTPLARVWVFPWRLSMPPGDSDVTAKGGAVAFAWYVWERGWRGPAQLGWLPSAPANGGAA